MKSRETGNGKRKAWLIVALLGLFTFPVSRSPLHAQRPTYHQQMQDNQRRLEDIRRERSEVEQELARLRKQVKKKGADLRRQSVQQRHKLRIRAKRLRYATEFFAGTFDGETSDKRRKDSLAALKDLQDALGGLNDIATRPALMTQVVGQGGDATGQPSVHPHLAAPQDQTETLLHQAEDAFTRFIDAKAFWKA